MESYFINLGDQEACEFGCPVPVKRILKSGWDQICQTGRLETNCTDSVELIVEIQAGTDDKSGERVSCQVNGITLEAEYEFWYTPQNNVHFTTPRSKFISNTFDATVFYGGWTIIEYLGEDWVVVQLKNETGACGDVCGDIVCQSGMLVKFKDCFSYKDTEDKADDEFAIEDATQWEEVTHGDL